MSFHLQTPISIFSRKFRGTGNEVAGAEGWLTHGPHTWPPRQLPGPQIWSSTDSQPHGSSHWKAAAAGMALLSPHESRGAEG